VAASAGAHFEEEAGWLVPADFGNDGAEYSAALSDAAVFDQSHHGKVEVSGADAAAFLHNLCTNDIRGLRPGQGCEAFLTTGQAKIVAHAAIFQVPGNDGAASFWLDLAPGKAAQVVQHLDHYHISEQIELVDRTPAFAQVHVAGPRARAVLGQAVGTDVPDLAELGLYVFNISAPGMCQVRRHALLGLPGYDILCPADGAEAFWQSVIRAGASAAGLRAYHRLRVEAGTPLDGVDIDATNLPQEVGRTAQAVSFTKGCYIGQETIARIRTYGHVNRSLVGLRFAQASEGCEPDVSPVPQGAKLYQAGKEAGQVTSSVLSPRLGTIIALAYVRRGCEEPGTLLEIEVDRKRSSAEVSSLPIAGS
jgi:folate-binding protein YgfZ